MEFSAFEKFHEKMIFMLDCCHLQLGIFNLRKCVHDLR